jgi:Ca2+-binding RTX toxin-like protein
MDNLLINSEKGSLSGTNGNDIFVIRPPQTNLSSFYTGSYFISNFRQGDKIGIVKGEIPLNEIGFDYDDLTFYGGRPRLLMLHQPTSTVLARFSFDSNPTISDVIELESSIVAPYTPISTFNILWGSGLNSEFLSIDAPPVPPTVELRDQIIGTERDDAIYGFDGSDRLLGLDGNDVIVGGNGSDRIAGGDGNDLLYGGDGKNIIKGGTGADSFVLDRFGFQDIPDFEIGLDKIVVPPGVDLSQIEIRIRFTLGNDRRFTEIYRAGYSMPLANVRNLGIGVALTSADLITAPLDLSQPGQLLQPGAPNLLLPAAQF